MSAAPVERLSRRAPEARRDSILDAARRLFIAEGVERTRMEQIAAAAGVSVGLIYRHHPTKAHLLAAVRDDFESRFLVALGEAPGVTAKGRRRFAELLTRLFDVAARNPELPAMLDLPTGAGDDGAVAPTRLQQAIEAMIAEGVASGEFRAVPARETAILSYAMVEAAMRDAFGTAAGAAPGAYVRLLEDAWSRWLLEDPPA